MLSLFKARRYADSELGELKYSRGLWRGTVSLDAGPVPLAVSGDRKTPSREALSLARSVRAHLASSGAAIEAELFSHYLAYADAIEGGEFEPDEPLPTVQEPSAIWAHVSPEFVGVTPLGGQLTTELGYTAAWEPEHLLGVRLQNGQLVELCGSTVEP